MWILLFKSKYNFKEVGFNLAFRLPSNKSNELINNSVKDKDQNIRKNYYQNNLG